MLTKENIDPVAVSTLWGTDPVPRRGLEPPIPCGSYLLKVVRVPISPPGQWTYYKRKTVDRKAAGGFSFLEIYATTFSDSTESCRVLSIETRLSSLGATVSSLMRCIMRALRSWRRTALVAFSRMK